jgi:hypothetical protein
MKKIIFLNIFLALFLFAAYIRIADLRFSDMLIDVGYELEAARIINQKKELPLVGPSISIKGLFIPPTYLYLISFLYFISQGEFLLISLFYAVMGLLSILFLSLSIYLLSNKNKLVSLIFLGVFTFWHYHVHLSRTVWHPYPTIFFSSLSIFLGLISLKSGKLLFLFLSQYSFFTALSIYPSPVFILPIIYFNSYVFCKKSNNSSLRSFLLSTCSMLTFFMITYTPQFIFEVQHNWPSFFAMMKHHGDSVSIGLNETIIHFWKIFEVFFRFFFNEQSMFWKALFVFFMVFLLLINKLVKQKAEPVQQIFDNPFLFLWILIIIYFLLNLNVAYAPHRIDLIAIFFFIFLAIKTKQILDCKKNIYKMILILPIVVFIMLFFVYNIPLALYAPSKKDSSSYVFNKVVGEAIFQKIDEHELSRSEVMISYHFNRDYEGQSQNICNDYGYLWKTKLLAQPIDHLVNKKFKNENPISSNYQIIDSYDDNDRFYFLIYNDYLIDNQCFDRFISDMSKLKGEGFFKLIIKDSFYLSFNDQEFQVLLIENKFSNMQCLR